MLIDTGMVPPTTTVRTYTPYNASLMGPVQWWSGELAGRVDGGGGGGGAGLPPYRSQGNALGGPSTAGTVLSSQTPLEQVVATGYDSEFAYYCTTITAAQAAAMAASAAPDGTVSLTLATSRASAWLVFVDGVASGVGYELSEQSGGYSMTISVNVTAGARNLTLLSESMGIHKGSDVTNGATPPTYASGAYKGIITATPNSVVLGGVDLTSNGWSMRSALVGEALQLGYAAGGGRVAWLPSTPAAPGPLSWLRFNFTVPAPLLAALQGDGPGGVEVDTALVLDVTGLTRGRIFVNGFNAGRYWTRMCGSGMCQRYYYLPADLLVAGAMANSIVLVDVEGPSNTSAATLAVTRVAAPPPCGPATVSLNATMQQCDGGMGFDFVPSGGAGSAGQLVARNSSTGGRVCVGVAGTNPSTGAPNVAAVPCTAGDTSQLWTLGAGSITNSGSGACLDIPGQNSALGTRVETWSCNGGSNQQWTYAAAGSGWLVSGLNGACLALCAQG